MQTTTLSADNHLRVVIAIVEKRLERSLKLKEELTDKSKTKTS